MKKILILFFLILPNLTFAETLDFKKNGGKIYIPTYQNWEMLKDVFGIPYVYNSPKENGQRSNISFTDSGVEIVVDFNELGKTQDRYKENKQKWIKTINGKISQDGFLPYKKWKNKYQHIVYQIGLNFNQGNKEYVETSFYINCKERLIYSKAMRLKNNLIHQSKFENLINNLDCKL